MSNENMDKATPFRRGPSLPIIGGLILFSVILGTTKLGYIPMPTAAIYATTMHLPTIIASLLEGWPVGMVVGTVFGITSMYTAGSPMAQDPLVALVPRMIVGITPFIVYSWMGDRNEYMRLGVAAVVGTMTNTCGFLGMAVVRGFLEPSAALNIAFVHGIPESAVAVIIVIPACIILRRARSFLDGLTN